MNKALKIILVIAASIVGLVLAAFIAVSIFSTVHYGDYSSVAERAFLTGGIDEGFVPQGMARSGDGIFILSGYMKDGSASRLYLQSEDGAVSYVVLQNEDGSARNTHVGGVAANGGTVWLADDSRVYVLSLDELLNTENGDGFPISEELSFDAGNSAAFASCDGETLYVGEFSGHSYTTDEAHYYTTPGGEQNHAIMCAFTLDSGSELGVVSTVPAYAVSIPDLVQGMAVTPEGIALSTSYSVADSHIYFYSDAEPAGEIEINGEKTPLTYLDSSLLVNTIVAPPMSEGMVYNDGELYILYESASNKYIFGKLFCDGKYVYKYPLS